MKKNRLGLVITVFFCSCLILSGCSKREKISGLQQLNGKEFAIPTGTVADQLVLSKLPDAKFKYFNSVMDAALAVKAGKADAAAYDEPILKNIAAKNSGLVVLKDMITVDNYGFAVRRDDRELKNTIDAVVADLKKDGTTEQMLKRWFPKSGNPASMPKITSTGNNGVLRMGTSSVTEPFSFVDGSREIVGYDIELAQRIAKKLDKKLVIVNMDFGGMIPALISGKVDMIAACITITSERSKQVLFSTPYYVGGIAALVRE
ncbi:MAG: transporter substrate-binding domain-containing protein [Chlorobium sp.]|jgi:polar amino acid transport system substrate-binding protein|nr:transporter substrate-binding domain-containing protein [Chlorobium sp.]